MGIKAKYRAEYSIDHKSYLRRLEWVTIVYIPSVYKSKCYESTHRAAKVISGAKEHFHQIDSKSRIQHVTLCLKWIGKWIGTQALKSTEVQATGKAIL